jgi:exonuclease III
MVRLISWNLYKENKYSKWRIHRICIKILENNPDIICFQEVLPTFFEIVKNELKEYSSSFEDIYENNTTEREYGEIIFSKIPIISKGYDKMKSSQGRINSWVEVNINDNLLRINTSQLESARVPTSYFLEKAKIIRQEQLSFIKEINSEKDFWVWIGDTNLKNDEEHEMFNSGINTYFSNRFFEKRKRDEIKVPNYQFSYDKIWLNNVTLKSLFTISSRDEDGEYLSSHDGLLCDIEV